MLEGDIVTIAKDMKLEHERDVEKLRNELKRVFEEKNAAEIEAANLKNILNK